MIINKQADTANNYMYTRMVDAVRKKMAKEGKDFDEELKRWKEREKEVTS